jgi:hypothetical protein
MQAKALRKERSNSIRNPRWREEEEKGRRSRSPTSCTSPSHMTELRLASKTTKLASKTTTSISFHQLPVKQQQSQHVSSQQLQLQSHRAVIFRNGHLRGGRGRSGGVRPQRDRVNEDRMERGRETSSDAPAGLYSRRGLAKAETSGSSHCGIARETMPDLDGAKPQRGHDGRALNPTRGVAENGRPLVNTNCPLDNRSKRFIVPPR